MDRADFSSEMYVAVIEQSFLFELALGVTDVMRDGTRVPHGPWAPSDCSAVMIAWFDRDWIFLHRSPGDDTPVPRAYARDVLLDPARWKRENAEGCFALMPTASAPDDYRHWLSAVPTSIE